MLPNARNPRKGKLEAHDIKIGDSVLVSRETQLFQKGYTQTFNREIFKVSDVLTSTPPTYKLKSWTDEPILGTFYRQELQPVSPPQFYRVERILARKTVGKCKKVLVKWLGWPESAATWQNIEDNKKLS